MWNRYLRPALVNHLDKHRQMAFLMGPRQVGKTTLAKSLLKEDLPGENYFNWDIPEHRKILLTQIFPGKHSLKNPTQERVCFDEIHKYKRWKNTLKGLFDYHEPRYSHWIITGSAALNIYRRGQDSMLGRYFGYTLYPLSVAELCQKSPDAVCSLEKLCQETFSPPTKEEQDALQQLFDFGGFPEPLTTKDTAFLKQWRASRLDRLINQDLASTEMLRNLSLVENLMFLLPDRVGSPLSLNSLREDLEIHFATAKHWIELLERVFYGIRIFPYTTRRSRMLKKEAKWYLWDWTEIENPGIRFENMVAIHLLKYVSYVNELGLGDLTLHFIRDKEKREVDFLICESHKPQIAIECKFSDGEPSPHLMYYAEQLKLKRCIQLVFSPITPKTISSNEAKIDLIPAASFLSQLV